MGVTQKDIAQRLGISRAQVGYALTGSPEVSQATRDKVGQVARELGYTQYSNQSARGLIAKRYSRRAATGIIGVLLPENYGLQRGTPYFDPYYRGIEEAAEEAGLDVFLCQRRKGALPRLVQECGVDGVVAPGLDTTDEIRSLGLPLVILDGIRTGYTCVLPDGTNGIEQVVRHLAELGHRRIAYLGYGPRSGSSDPERESKSGMGVLARRVKAFREAMKSGDFDFDPGLVEATLELEFSHACGAAGVSRLLARDRSFTALVCYNDAIAMGAVRQLISEGLRVPEDISVTGFDDISEAYSFAPRLTSVATPRREMGRRAVQLLREHIADPDREPRQEEFSRELVVRETTAQCRG